MSLPEHILSITDHLREQGFADEVDVMIILGSGLGSFAREIQDSVTLPYSDIPGFPETSVPGHDGVLYSGYINSSRVLAFSGRFHHYEGHPMSQTILPVQVGRAMGAKLALISNAAGGIAHRFKVSDLMLIDDIMRVGMNITGNTDPAETGYRFQNDRLIQSARSIANRISIPVDQGCYMYMKGPSYETPAEIRALRSMGADAVGMSTAPELLEAQRLEMKCMGVSLITNMAAGIAGEKLDHGEIKEAATRRQEDFSRLFKAFVLEL